MDNPEKLATLGTDWR